MRFVDLDDRVLDCFPQSSVREVWAVHGEEAWRSAELAALQKALSVDDQILALGGGVPMIEAARRLIEAEQRADRVRVIYLECNVPELIRRLRDGPGDRPSLTGRDMAEEVAVVLRRREPTYRALADARCDASGSDRQVVVDAVVEVMGLTRPGRQGEADPGESDGDAETDAGGR